MSNSLGVNCNYCHTTSAFGRWERSTPQRATAWYGIRMVRELNSSYLIPIKSLLPENRLSAEGDGPKVGCATCHKGTYKPLYGVTMLTDYPVLAGLYVAPPAAEPVPSPVSAPASPAPNDTKKVPAAAAGKSAAAGPPLAPKAQGQVPQKSQVQGPQALQKSQVQALQGSADPGVGPVQGSQGHDRQPVLVAGSAPAATRADPPARP
jgi:hypothetical protein